MIIQYPIPIPNKGKDVLITRRTTPLGGLKSPPPFTKEGGGKVNEG